MSIELEGVVVVVQDNDILQFTSFATLQGQQVLNVFHYLYFSESAINPSLADVATAWGIEFDTRVVRFFASSLVYSRVIVDNLTDGLEFSDGSFVASGDETGETLPVNVTLSVKLIRQNKLTRNGRKSFSGLTEAMNLNGSYVEPAGAIGSIESFCGDILSLNVASISPDPVILSPVIVGRTKDVNGVYQLDLTKINPIVDAIVDPILATQNTRKRP